MAGYKWELLYDEEGGHRVFMEKGPEHGGRLALCDRSGSFPERCEGGVFWLAGWRSYIEVTHKAGLIVEVYSMDSKRTTRVAISLELARWLTEQRGWTMMLQSTNQKVIVRVKDGTTVFVVPRRSRKVVR